MPRTSPVAARRRRSDTVSQVLESLLRRMPSSLRLRLRQAMAAQHWDEVVGPQVAAATRIVAIRNGVITVRTRSGPWAQDVALHAAYIVDKLNERLGGKLVEKLVFQAYGLDPLPEPPPAATPQDLAAQPLTAAQQAALVAGVDALPSDIPEEWRQRAVRCMTNHARVTAWRLDHGWQRCSRCGSLSPFTGAICRACHQAEAAR
ncbi:MAG: DUF721 domain-containing protein [Armatimonadetes bacterium]|nr:DUF721 domain-containing protein [Armatimonadota bacterium]MDE2208037.1 DUF721 domain-containing protein [Armatimonadota bacterium]